MSTQHTHGPWELRHAADNSGDIGIVGDGGCLAECFPAIRSANEGAHAECGANAKLIAAAPDLLAALVMVRDADEDCKRDGLKTIPAAARATIDAAIKLATGSASMTRERAKEAQS